MNTKYLSAFLVCVSAAMWGFDGVVLTPRLYNLDVSYVVFILHALPFLGMNLILYKEYKWIGRMSRSDLLFFFLIALFGGALGTLSIVKALFLVEFKHLTVVALLNKLQPVFAILLAGILLKERIGKNFILWASVAICGGYFLTFQFHVPEIVHGGKMLPAALYALLAAFSFGSATVFGKRVLFKVPFQTALFFRYGITSVLMLAMVLINGKYSQLSVTTPTNWTFFVIIGLTTGSGAILLYYYALRHISASVSTICELCFPISSIFFDYVFNGNVLSPIQWVSASVMLFAIVKITVNQNSVSENGPCLEPACEASA
ncbi:MAG: DMT family transporter [Desulfobacteraceae bacterium]|nr:DMT family transporter [Desulfobacteraceae bacterium]